MHWQATIAGLPLEEADEIALAYALALRDVPDAQALLDAQRARIGNPDRRVRFEFVRPAASPEATERERWFHALAPVAARQHEVWVGEGLSLLHHPLRAAASAGLVKKALDMLPDVNGTGNLFFDSAWLAGTLNGHASAAVAATVQERLDSLPADYPPKLRELLLQRSDLLFRAARHQGR